jgi:hypothetical protein
MRLKMFISYLNAALFARLVTAGPVLVDVGVNETFEAIQLAQDSQQFFTGDDTVKQWLLRFAYIPSQGHEPNWSHLHSWCIAFLHSWCWSQKNSHPTGPLPLLWQGIADIGCEAGKCLVWVEPAQLQ